ncbi:hypothetical protein APUTEX25_000168 [Auxenochlorella protothecoides]|uniref:Major facilitator superfamily (MFS) profile domain-containing protein n=1 Tax=Auxenochlorella protothecoides TaxID=3075 RepID=A0A3M7L0S4_AUXPR|nr:hypothetical protein APUTEX25_000168 [Auxenochlorella protothecoides]|eukprot:RMZ55585.1 hypothetical protein APUTEX25_000168 [Auxenochlorella protothecoides]
MASGWGPEPFEILDGGTKEEAADARAGEAEFGASGVKPTAGAHSTSQPLQPPTAVSRREAAYMMAIFCLTGCLLFADQNLMAPNLTAVARDFGFSPDQRDRLLGGVVAASFYLVGAPAALLFGWLCDRVDRRRLLFAAVVLGEAPALLTLAVRRYWQLLLLRVLTGISLGGAFPLIFSLVGDLTTTARRATAAAVIQVSLGAGLAVGQGIAGFVGPSLGWRAPFAIVAAPTVVLAVLMLCTTRDPPRGRTEEALAEVFEGNPGFVYDERMTWSKAGILLRTPTNICAIGQGLFGCIPWGMLLTFLNDFLAQERRLSVQAATTVLLCIGIGGALGVLGGGLLGQWIYNRRKAAMPVFIGLSTMLGTLPMWYVLNGDVGRRYTATLVAALGVGFASSTMGPNARAMLLNVNEPEMRGLALALQSMLDDLGKGLGPVFVAALISGLGRTAALNLAAAGWLPCGALILLAAFSVERDEEAVQARLRQSIARMAEEVGERELLTAAGSQH